LATGAGTCGAGTCACTGTCGGSGVGGTTWAETLLDPNPIPSSVEERKRIKILKEKSLT
jgi:hypothetical protein